MRNPARQTGVAGGTESTGLSKSMRWVCSQPNIFSGVTTVLSASGIIASRTIRAIGPAAFVLLARAAVAMIFSTRGLRTDS